MENPYASPKSDAELQSEAGQKAQRGLPPRRASFSVGEQETHLVEIYLSSWGEEVYMVDGEEVLRESTMAMKVLRQFEVGETEKHTVEVRIDMGPSWKSLSRPDWQAEVYVDNNLVIEELFPIMRKNLETLHRIVNISLAIGLAILLFAASIAILSWL